MDRTKLLENILEDLSKKILKKECMRCATKNTQGPLCTKCHKLGSKLFNKIFEEKNF